MPGANELASYALGAQVVLTEALPLLEPAILRLENQAPPGESLHQQVKRLQSDIARQQEAADKIIGGDTDLTELRHLAQHNLSQVRDLQADMLSTTEHVLSLRIERLQRDRWVVALLLAGTLGMLFYVFAGIYLSTLQSLRRLSQGTQAFCSGRLDTRIHIDTRDELVLVARNFNTVATEFEQLLDVIRRQNESRQRELEALVAERTHELEEKNAALYAAGARVQEELQLARDMQQAILPQSFPHHSTWQVHAVMHPARELGGDFYDCFMLPDGRCGLVVADVSGKGVGAAFFMAVSRTVLLDLAMRNDPPAQVLANANNLLCERNPMELFVTVFFGIYNPTTGVLTYANAGHPPPLRRDAQGTVTPLACTMDTALGVMPELDYANQTLTLQPSDTLLLYTDGVTEAFSPEALAYGEDRLMSWLAAAPPWHGAQALIDGLVRDVSAFVHGAEASDDLTCLVLQHQPKAAAMTAAPTVIHRNKRLLLDYELPSRTEKIADLAAAVEQALPDRADLAFTANLCLEELITNTIQHGLGSAPDRVICVRLSLSDEWLEIVVKDDAPPFDPFAQAPAPDLDADLDARAIGGLGVHLVKTMMDDARAYYDGSGNLIVLLKTLRSA
jgi:serine phosphatase RsbU (regulator of sigma subunit)/anti-sigma regulatory factor (Ser/Thr protein kinase)